MKSDYYIQKGNERLKKNDVVGAKDFFRKAAELNPDSANELVTLARIEFVTGNRVEAESLLNKALRLRSNHPLAHALWGTFKILDGKFPEAIQLLEKAIQLDEGLGMAYMNLGIAQREIGLVNESECNIRKAIQINGDDFEAHYALAHTLCLQLKMKDGILALLDCIKINPLFVKAYAALGALYAKRSRPDLAEQIYDECLKRVPKAIVIREKLVELYSEYGKTEAAQAEMELIAQQRGSLSDWLRFGTYSILNKNFKAAEFGFQQAAKVAPHSWEPHYNLGDLYDAVNRTDSAGKEYELAVNSNASNYKPHNGMGLWLMKQNRWNEAAEQFKKAHQLAPDATEPAYNLALVLAQMNQKNDAKALLNQLLSVSMVPDAFRLLNVL